MEEHFPCYNGLVSVWIQKNVYVLGGVIYEKKNFSSNSCICTYSSRSLCLWLINNNIISRRKCFSNI